MQNQINIKTKMVNGLIYFLEVIILIYFLTFLILAPYEHKRLGKAALGAGLGGWLLINILKYRYRFYRGLIPANPLNRSILLFNIACLFSIIFSLSPYRSQGVFFDRYLLYFVFFYTGNWLANRSKKNLYILFSAVFLSSFIFAIGGIRDYFYYRYANPVLSARLLSVFGKRILYYGFPLYCSYFTPIVFSLFIFTKKQWLKITGLITLISLLLCSLWSGTRAAWLSIFLSLLFISILSRNKKNIFIVVVITLSLISLILLNLFSPTLKYRLKSIPYISQWSNRLPLYKSALSIFKDYAVFGIGLGIFEKALRMPQYELPADYPVAKELNLHAHNTYLEVAAEMGVVGFAAFIWIFLNFFKKVFKTARKEWEVSGTDKAIFLGLSGAVFSILIFAFSTTIITVGVSNSGYFWFLLGMATSFIK